MDSLHPELIRPFLSSIKVTHIFLLVYVGDIVVTASQISAIDTLIHNMSLAFPLRDLGKLAYFLGLELDYSANGVFFLKENTSNTFYPAAICYKPNP